MNFLRLAISLVSLICISVSILADEVHLSNGTSLSGKISEMQGGFLVLQLAGSNGNATQRLDPDAIKSLVFSDASDSLEQRALRRSRFLPLLTLADTQVLTEFLHLQVTDGYALSALSYAKQWHPKNNYTELDVAFREILISASLASGSHNEALIHARNWLSLTPRPYSQSLPWEVAATHFLSGNDPETALWIALQPIAHQSAQTGDDLGKLKQIAADAYLSLGYEKHAAAMLNPELPYPQTPILNLSSLDSNSLSFAEVFKTRIPQ